MRPFREFKQDPRARINFVLTDVDDTLTKEGRLDAATYAAMERLYTSGIKVIPVTAGSAGWCDNMVRMWPVAAIVGENGAFYFHCGDIRRTVLRRFWTSTFDRAAHANSLVKLAADLAATIPSLGIADDQAFRMCSLALALPNATSGAEKQVGRAETICREHGAATTRNALWLIATLGDFDKLKMSKLMMEELFGRDLERWRHDMLYVGDSFNDAPMFGFFPNSVGISSVRNIADKLPFRPRWVTQGGSGAGFVEIASVLLDS